MRFWLESSARRARATLVATSALTLAALLPAACSEGDKASQDQAALSCDVSYENFAGPFLLNWCVGCHSSSLGMGDRQNAPLGMDFDTLTGIQGHKELARSRVVELRTMPPVGGPSEAERELFGKWLDCGLPAEGKGFTPPPPTGKPVVVPAPTGTCAEPRSALPASVLPRCQAATLDCVV